MKALLFVLLLVAFMCKDSVESLKCYVCYGKDCSYKMNCLKKERFCYTAKYGDAFKGKGCAEVCLTPKESENMCCTTDYCNFR
ncbi:actiflagelin-like [Thamnophis elegans]|uniref:actiflagelin-like n=1 Tax=Thamnophis elegans TaxID=35005 RepID=UPI0013790F43|nr:actiflagelin-like [Thamnophis elegans]